MLHNIHGLLLDANLINVFRFINFALAIATAGTSLFSYGWWIRQILPARLFLMGSIALIAVTGYGSIESLVQNAPPGLRTYFYTPCLIWTLAGMIVLVVYLNRKKKEYEPKE